MEWFFDKTDFSLYKPLREENNWLDIMIKHSEKPNADIYAAIIGIDANVADLIRRQFFVLKKGRAEEYHLADFGNLKLVPHQETNEMRLREVCKFLLEKGIIPIVIGGMSEIALSIYLAISEWKTGAKLAYFDAAYRKSDANFLLKRILHTEIEKPANIFLGGYQEYLCDREELLAHENRQYELMSLGKIRQNFTLVEPFLRDASMFCFNANTLADPMGFTGEEACQLAWYSGMNENMAIFSLLDFSTTKKHAKIAATMLWYFIEGTYQSACEQPNVGVNFERIVVGMDKSNEVMYFLRSTKSNRWWYEFDNQKYFVPCSYEDYLSASNGEIPESWWKAHNRLYFN